MADLADSVARRYAVVGPHLSEFQRRLWLGAEAAELGPGGVAVVAEATGVAADTVRRGRKEADEGIGPGAVGPVGWAAVASEPNRMTGSWWPRSSR